MAPADARVHGLALSLQGVLAVLNETKLTTPATRNAVLSWAGGELERLADQLLDVASESASDVWEGPIAGFDG